MACLLYGISSSRYCMQDGCLIATPKIRRAYMVEIMHGFLETLPLFFVGGVQWVAFFETHMHVVRLAKIWRKGRVVY